MTIGTRIRNRREELGLTQLELALRMGYKSRAAICNVEKDKEDLTTTRIRKFAEALECSPAFLMGWEQQLQNVQKAIEPIAKQMSDFGNQISRSLSYQVDIKNGMVAEIESLTKKYDSSEIIRAMKFVEAFLNATPERQKIATEILQSHQADS